MKVHVYKKKRRKNGKMIPDRCYRGRYRLDGDFATTEIPLNTPDKQVAEKRLRELVKEKERERAGLIAPKSERVAADKPLATHLKEFVSDLKTKGRVERYIHDLESRASLIFKSCKWQYARDIHADGFMQWRARYKAAPKTLNEYLNACNSLLNWMVKHQRIASNPLSCVEKVDIRGKQQLRRALTDEELSRLLDHSEDYRLLYITAVYTGLRQNELLQLVWQDVYLDEEHPYVIAQASTTKNRQRSIIPLHPKLVEDFKEAQKAGSKKNFVFPQYTQPDRRFRRHLKAAGIDQYDENGRKLDFHALRYTFATKLAKQGVSQRLAQELMRHSDPKLTANIYTDVTHLPTFDAVETLPWHSETCPPIRPPASDFDSHSSSQNGTIEGVLSVMQDLEKEQDMPDLAYPVTNGQMVGPTGFEPATPSPPAKCATRLRYGPTQKRRTMLLETCASSLYLIFTCLDTDEGLIHSRDGLATAVDERFSAVAIVGGSGRVVDDSSGTARPTRQVGGGDRRVSDALQILWAGDGQL